MVSSTYIVHANVLCFSLALSLIPPPHHCTPLPLHLLTTAHSSTPSPLHTSIPSTLHPLTTIPPHHYTPSPLHPLTTTPPHHYTPYILTATHTYTLSNFYLTPSLPHPCTPSQGPEHCIQCRNYYIEEILEVGSAARVCVETCPQGTYLNTTSRQCIPCHEACLGGCAGPLPYVNRTFGCLECDRVELDREGRQVGLGEMT